MRTPPDILRIEGNEASLIDVSLPDGGLPPYPGVGSYQVFRASRVMKPDDVGFTYHHHVDIAIWRGRLCVAWNSCEKDEDLWPSRELFSTSADGIAWEKPRELFPMGLSTPLRMYFYLARNGVMLAIAGLRRGTDEIDEEGKGALVVRPIHADHSLGEVFLLQSGHDDPRAARFDTSSDNAFVAACRELLDNRVYLEQQDLGRLLGDRAMVWHRPESWPAGAVPGDNAKWVAGKAYSFFKRPDGVRVGISKMGWTTTTRDEGLTWTQPVVPPTLLTDKAKVWSQRTPDGRYALVYNPTKGTRHPLAIALSDDGGATFRDLRIVHGELPLQRYEGRFRSVGPQYTRGVSEWSDDGSRAGEGAIWAVYSMSKEDIWVSRIPLTADANAWNVYRPAWCDASANDSLVELTDRDPYDHAAATRNFATAERVAIDFSVECTGGCSIDLLSQFGSKRAITLTPPVGISRIKIEADASKQLATITLNGKPETLGFLEPAANLQRIAFRTGPYRRLGGTEHIDPETDRPTGAAMLRVRGFHLV